MYNITKFNTKYGEYFVYENDHIKSIRSKNYNYDFNKINGLFMRWGKSLDDDPQFSPFGPEILDLENSTICGGTLGNNPCRFCYKANTPTGQNMSFENFKIILDKINKYKTLTQIAIGSDATLKSNPDIWKMFEYCRESGIIPNITVANIDDTVADQLAKLAGACAVSRYSNKNHCYDSVKKLTDRGMKQINIHQILSQEALDQALETINDIGTDPRLDGLNAIVFLSLKQVGRGSNHSRLSQEQFKMVVDKAMNKNINFGFDSCSQQKFINSIRNHKNYDYLEQNSEPCESLLMSIYIDVNAMVFPCSFTENINFDNHDWTQGINMLEIDDFLNDVWYNEKVIKFREDNINNNRKCIAFDI